MTTVSKQEVLVFGEIRHAINLLEEMKRRYEFKVLIIIQENKKNKIKLFILFKYFK